MSPFLQVLLSLFGAALLGNIIGWFARRIVALRDEKVLREQLQQQHREIAGLQKELAIEHDEKRALQQKISGLELEVQDNVRLNQTIEASDKEIAALRAESLSLKQQVTDEADKVKSLQQESLMRSELAGQQRIPATDTHQLDTEQNHVANSQGERDTNFARREFDVERYALGSVASGSTDLEVDDDIADLTSDLSSVLTPELQAELGSEATTAREPHPVSVGQASGAGLFSRFNRKKKS